MEETELIHQSSSAITRLISPPINLLIIEKQQLTVKGGCRTGDAGGRRMFSLRTILVRVPVSGCAALAHMMQAFL